MVTGKATVKDTKGVHLRYAELFCQAALDFQCSIKVRAYNDRLLNGKSILGLLGACIKPGQEIEIICEGIDEAEALENLLRLVESQVGEEGMENVTVKK